jgi:hypothetical protein
VLSRIRRAWGRHGEAAEIRGALEWKDAGEAGERYITVSSREGTTTVSGSTNLSNAAIVTYLPAGIVGLTISLAGLARFVKAESDIGRRRPTDGAGVMQLDQHTGQTPPTEWRSSSVRETTPRLLALVAADGEPFETWTAHAELSRCSG